MSKLSCFVCLIDSYLTINWLDTFSFSWQPETKFLFSRSRLPLKDSKGPFTFVENQEIEVYSKANEQEAFGWWKAVIKVGHDIVMRDFVDKKFPILIAVECYHIIWIKKKKISLLYWMFMLIGTSMSELN